MEHNSILPEETLSAGLIKYLLAERPEYRETPIPRSEEERFRLYRSLVNIRPAAPVSDEYLEAEESYLRSLTAAKGITDVSELAPAEKNIYLWQGDITTLRCGAIVNAANSGMTGCYQPCHSCIDNCIHTFAGVLLRAECTRIMETQRHEEPTGQAKLTRAYCLPCDHVIHTVGPIVQGQLNERHCALLESCYSSCLELAAANDIGSIAFCCISTGVFGFPKKEAARIAVRTVREYLKTHEIKVVFNVFGDDDREIYEELLS